MIGNNRWRAAIAGSLLLNVGLFAAISLFWHWDVMQSRQPIYVEVSMAELFAPLDGPAGGGGQPERATDPVKHQPQLQPPLASGFSDQVAPQAIVAGSGGLGTGGSGGGTGGGHGGGKGTGVGPGTGTGTGTGTGATRGPRIVNGGRPDYPEYARAKGWEGTVKLQILVNTDGRVEDVRIVAGSGYAELDQTAQRAVRSWRFSPALKNGSPVAAWATVPVVFDLR
jgi:protein TonB